MSDTILLLLCAVTATLLMLGGAGLLFPVRWAALATAGLSGLAGLGCLASLAWRDVPATLVLPVGPPGLSLALTLDALSALFLLIVCAAGSAIAAYTAVTGAAVTGAAVTGTAFSRRSDPGRISLCLGGVAVSLLAADAVALAAGLTLTATAFGPRRTGLASPALALLALVLLTPAGQVPAYAAIRAGSPDNTTAALAAVLGATAAALIVIPTRRRPHWHERALTAGVLLPCAVYTLIRLVVDLPATAAAGWWGFPLLAVSAVAALLPARAAARHPDLDGAVSSLTLRQAGLAIAGVGLALIARGNDLPQATALALAATLLLAIGCGMAGTLAGLAAYALGEGAGTLRLARLGGLSRTMPAASAGLAAALFALSPLPCGLGFAALWLAFQALAATPHTGGPVAQVSLALTGAALALSAALATSACLRLAGVVLLSRPRNVRGSVASDVAAAPRGILLTLTGLTLTAGALPGPLLLALGEPAIRALSGGGFEARAGWSAAGYAALPLLALLGLFCGGTALAMLRFGPPARIAAAWNGGAPPEPDLPFGDPVTQTAGAGFVPVVWLPRLPEPPQIRLPACLTQPVAGLWTVLAAFAATLIVLALSGPGGGPL